MSKCGPKCLCSKLYETTATGLKHAPRQNTRVRIDKRDVKPLPFLPDRTHHVIPLKGRKPNGAHVPGSHR